MMPSKAGGRLKHAEQAGAEQAELELQQRRLPLPAGQCGASALFFELTSGPPGNKERKVVGGREGKQGQGAEHIAPAGQPRSTTGEQSAIIPAVCHQSSTTHCCSMAMRQVTQSMGLQGGEGRCQGSAVQSTGAPLFNPVYVARHSTQLSRRGRKQRVHAAPAALTPGASHFKWTPQARLRQAVHCLPVGAGEHGLPAVAQPDLARQLRRLLDVGKLCRAGREVGKRQLQRVRHQPPDTQAAAERSL